MSKECYPRCETADSVDRCLSKAQYVGEIVVLHDLNKNLEQNS
eukprot:XP_001706818.1 Hypothetical protein GL50803_11195 [Giardia lamblia ATCC 50803]